MNRPISTYFIETQTVNHEIKVELFYEKGGYNKYTKSETERGYKLSMTAMRLDMALGFPSLKRTVETAEKFDITHALSLSDKLDNGEIEVYGNLLSEVLKMTRWDLVKVK